MRSIWCIAAAVLLASGCGPSLPPKPQTFPVHGTVTLAGKPVHGGRVFFHAIDTANVPSGQARIDKDGNYKAFVFVDQDGLVAGEYKLKFDDEMQNAEQLGAEPTKFPAKYKKNGDAEVKVAVKAEDNSLDITLE